MWACGKNPYGEIDGGSNTPLDPNYSSPIQIPGIWKQVGPETNNIFGVKFG